MKRIKSVFPPFIIKDEKGAKAMQKPIGTYITIEAPEMNQSDENYHKPVSDEIAISSFAVSAVI